MIQFLIKVFLICSIFFISVFSQEDGPKGAGENDKSIMSEMREKRAARKAAREARRREREHKKAVKEYHKRTQTKAVRKRMKESQRKADMYNQNKREPWYRRIFKRKPKTRKSNIRERD